MLTATMLCLSLRVLPGRSGKGIPFHRCRYGSRAPPRRARGAVQRFCVGLHKSAYSQYLYY